MNWDSRACNCTNGTGCAPAVAGQVVNDTASAALVAAYPQIKTAVVGGVDICVPTNNTFENNRYCSSAGSGRYLDENASVVAGWHSVARNNTEVTTCKSDDTTVDMGDNAGNPNFAQLIPYDPCNGLLRTCPLLLTIFSCATQVLRPESYHSRGREYDRQWRHPLSQW